MLWQGCNLSPRELERKPPRSVWATQLPASRPIRWIVRESREAHRADTAAPRPWGRMCLGQLGDDLRTTPHGRATRPCAAHGRTSARLSEPSTPIQPLCNRFPTPIRTQPTATQPFPKPSNNRFPTPPQPSETSTPPQPSFSRQTDDSALGKHPRLNHPSCRIQERFRHNHPPFVILQSLEKFALFRHGCGDYGIITSTNKGKEQANVSDAHHGKHRYRARQVCA